MTTVGTWLKANGLAIYDTRPFAIDTEGDVSYTRNGSDIYAITMTMPSDNKVVLTHLRQGSPHLGNVTQVELLGHPGTHPFVHNDEALTIHAPADAAESLAYSFKITHDRPLVNNDDEGVEYEGKGWFHEVNRGIGNTNNNVHITTENGDAATYAFTGTGIEFITETDTTHGKVAVYIDNVHRKTVDAASKLHGVQVTLHSVKGLKTGKHTIRLVKVSGERMILDAFKIL